jgi:hypothetical protein
MNVLILTPDAVGSTLLQRLITIYMQFHSYDKPVINLHELTNGLVKYHSEKFNQDVLGKPDKKSSWGYHQSLEEVVKLLDSADHYKTSRLAQYHIKNRQDELKDQIPFYQYLNDNFFIISCRRHNVFDHALSWAITKITKKLNVYTPEEKLSSFYHLYRDQITIEPDVLIQTLNTYKKYVKWCDDHFSVGSYFYYDQHLPNIEKYILDLPIFAGQPQKISWDEKYKINFNDWNKCHFLSSDIGTIALDYQSEFKKLSLTATNVTVEDKSNKEMLLQSYADVSDPSWPKITSVEEYNNLSAEIRKECETIHKIIVPTANSSTITVSKNVALALPEGHLKFLRENSQNYNQANQSIADMVNDRTMISPPPIKKQTMNEKRFLVKNFNQCLDVYNVWIAENPEIGNQIDMSVIDQFAQIESSYWRPDAEIKPASTTELLGQQMREQ